MTEPHVSTGPNRALPGVVCAVVGVMASLVVLGWLIDVKALTGAVAGRPGMKMNTAAGALLSAGALWALRYERRDRAAQIAALVCAGIATLIGLLTHLIRDLSYLWVDPRVKYFD